MCQNASNTLVPEHFYLIIILIVCGFNSKQNFHNAVHVHKISNNVYYNESAIRYFYQIEILLSYIVDNYLHPKLFYKNMLDQFSGGHCLEHNKIK